MEKLSQLMKNIKFNQNIGGGENLVEKIPYSHMLGLLGILGLTAILALSNAESTSVKTDDIDLTTLDTFIPDGESLVPIRIENYESLDHIIGRYGVVDLFSVPLTGDEKAKKVASRVKIVRNSKNPRDFSVLVDAEKAQKIASHPGEFTVSIRNPKSSGTEFVKQKSAPQKRRVYFVSE